MVTINKIILKKLHIPYAEVEWDGKPTNRDKFGCDGLYIKSVKHFKSFYFLFPFKTIHMIIKNLINGEYKWR